MACGTSNTCELRTRARNAGGDFFFYSTVAFVMYVEVYVVSYGISIQLWYDVYTRTSNEREKQQVFVSVLTSQEEVYW